MVTLTACQTNQIQTKPPKPKLVIQRQDNGGICLDKENAVKLGTYIQALENQQ